MAPTTALASFQVRSGAGAITNILPEALYPTRTAFDIAKGKPKLLAAMNEFLDTAERSGLAQQIFDKWFVPNIAYKLTKDFVVGSPEET